MKILLAALLALAAPVHVSHAKAENEYAIVCTSAGVSVQTVEAVPGDIQVQATLNILGASNGTPNYVVVESLTNESCTDVIAAIIQGNDNGVEAMTNNRPYLKVVK